jgi:uncharacterized membrane protein
MKPINLKLILIFTSAFVISFAIIISASFIHTHTVVASLFIILFMYLGANTVLMSIALVTNKKWQYYFPGGVALGLGMGFFVAVGDLRVGVAIITLSLLILLYYGNYTRVLYENQIKIYIKQLVERQVFALSFIYAVTCAVIVFVNAPEVEKEILAKIATQADNAVRSDYIKPYLENPTTYIFLPDSQALSNLISGSLGTYSKHIIAVLSFAAFWAFEIAARLVWYFFLLTLRPSFYLLKKFKFITIKNKEAVKEILTI